MLKRLNLSQKMLAVLGLSIAFTILFSFFFLHFLNSELYFQSVERSIVYQGERMAVHCDDDIFMKDKFEKIEWFNIISEHEMVAAKTTEELIEHFPHEIDGELLLTSEEKRSLIQGEHIIKDGYVEHLDRNIIGAVFPMEKNNIRVGYLFIYVPLAAIQDVFQQGIPILLIVGTLFFLLLFFILRRVWYSLFTPMRQLQMFAKEVSQGNYSHRVPVDRDDEVGELSKAFNAMSRSLEEQEERKKEFTSNIVHELRTPLTYIRGYVHALREKIYASPEEASHYLETIDKETTRLNQLLNDLIELNHLQEQMYSVHKEPIPLAQLLHDTIDLFALQIDNKEITLTRDIDDSIIGYADEQRIQQVFYNTIDNAVKYCEQGGRISITLRETDTDVRYTITNTGVTIAEEDLDRIGERFFRTDKARTRTTGGTGLGLSIVQAIIQLHYGTFSIDSNPSDRTTVTIVCPPFDEAMKLEEQKNKEKKCSNE